MAEEKKQPSDVGGKWPAWLLVADGAVYWLALYYCVLVTFFHRDGVISGGMRLAGLTVALAVVLLGYSTRHIIGPVWKRLLFLDVAIFLFIGTWLPWQFSGIHVNKGLSFVWAAIEWWKLPANMMLMFKAAPFEVYTILALTLSLILLMATGFKKPVAVIICAFVCFYTYKLFGMESGVRLPAYLFFDIGLIVALIAGVKGYLRVFSRILIIDVSFIIIFLFYLGVIPIQGSSSWPGFIENSDNGVSLVYPRHGAKADFPLAFLRDFYVEPEKGYLYTSYGPTSGIVRVSLKKGKADIIHNPGIVRVLWSKPDMDEIYALDWMYADFYRIGKKDFKIISKTNLYDGTLVTPMSYVVSRGKLYVVSTDYPALTRFDLKTMKREARIDFRKLGVTKFRSGAWKCVLDEQEKNLFVELGPVDLKGRYAIARVRLDDFKIDGVGHLPEGGLELAVVPGGNSLLAPAFFSENMYQISMKSLHVERIIKGPLTCRNIAIDKSRGLIYATSYTKGMLFVINTKTGKTKGIIKTGKKTASLTISPEKDLLYFGSRSGIFSVYLPMFNGYIEHARSRK